MLLLLIIVYSFMSVILLLYSGDYLFCFLYGILLRIYPKAILPIENTDIDWWSMYASRFLPFLEHSESNLVLLNWFTSLVLTYYIAIVLMLMSFFYWWIIFDLRTSYNYLLFRLCKPLGISFLVESLNNIVVTSMISIVVYMYFLDIPSIINTESVTSITIEFSIFNNISSVTFYGVSFGSLFFLYWHMIYYPHHKSEGFWLKLGSVFMFLYSLFIIYTMLDNFSQLNFDSYNILLIHKIYVSRYNFILHQFFIIIITRFITFATLMLFQEFRFNRNNESMYSELPWYHTIRRISSFILFSHSLLIMQAVTILYILALPEEIITMLINVNN